ncbi:MAG: L,D-transpeptidase family protein [Alphaproteobacteria bacterium]
MDLIVSEDGQARFGEFVYRCAIGRGGIRQNKTEGDGASPEGAFALIRVMYRQDRLDTPGTTLTCTPISDTDGWCDAPDDPAYNRQVTLPHPASCENLFRSDGLYDVVVVTSHNADPVKPGAGSAIFVHVAGGPDYPPTEGCIAFALEDLLDILARWQPGTDRLVIG